VNRMERLTAILFLLQDGGRRRQRTSEEIAGHFEVSKRTILRDIQALCEMGVPILSRDGSGGGYSLPSHYHLSPLPLTVREAILLQLSLSTLANLADTPFAPERASLLAKLRALLPPARQAEAEEWMKSISIDVPKRTYTVPFVETLLQAAQERQWLVTTYRSARRVSTQRLLPKRVTSHSGFWYCEAYALEHAEERHYRVDRFVSVEPMTEPPDVEPRDRRPPYDHESHPEVIVRLTEFGVLQVERERHLGEAIIPGEEGGGIWQFRCPPSELDWLTRYLLSLGPHADIVAPEELRQRVRQTAKEIVGRYAP